MISIRFLIRFPFVCLNHVRERVFGAECGARQKNYEACFRT